MLLSKRVSLETQFKIEQVFFKGFYYFCRVIPSSLVLGLGGKVGMLAWRLKARRSTVLTNLEVAFGDTMTERERKEIAIRCYTHFGREMLRILILDKQAKKPLDSWVDIEGLDQLKNREKKGGVLVGGHLGCWELANLIMPKLGEDVTVFTGRHANKTADRWLNDIRKKAGTKTAGTDDDRTELYNQAKKGLVAIIGDQAPPRAPIMIDFFGRQSEAAQGPALLSLLNKVDFFYFTCVRIGNRYKIRFHKVEFEKGKSRKENIHRLTQAYFDVLQDDIRKYPEQYLWMHKRWKKAQDITYDDKDVLF